VIWSWLKSPNEETRDELVLYLSLEVLIVAAQFLEKTREAKGDIESLDKAIGMRLKKYSTNRTAEVAAERSAVQRPSGCQGRI